MREKTNIKKFTIPNSKMGIRLRALIPKDCKGSDNDLLSEKKKKEKAGKKTTPNPTKEARKDLKLKHHIIPNPIHKTGI